MLYMIKSFKHKGLEDFFYTGSKRGILPNHANRLERILDRLNAATEIKDMNYPGSFLHQLKMTRRPTHPGNILREDYLVPLSVKIQDMAEILGISRKTLSKIINERGSITPEMALRLSRAFDTSPDFWLNLQKNFDLWVAEQTSTEWQKVKPFPKHILHRDSTVIGEPVV